MSYPVIGFSSDSFSQKPDDVYSWRITVAKNGAYGGYELGDKVTIKITRTNTIFNYDNVYGGIFKNSETETYEKLLGSYHDNLGIDILVGWIIPHNETAVKLWYNALSHYQYCNWTGGTNGYNGKWTGWDGNETGDPGKLKEEIKYNLDGVLEYHRYYNGTGSGWENLLFIELITGPAIPGFLFLPVIFIFCIALIRYIILKNEIPSKFIRFSSILD